MSKKNTIKPWDIVLAEKLITGFSTNLDKNSKNLYELNNYSKKIFEGVINEYDKFTK